MPDPVTLSDASITEETELATDDLLYFVRPSEGAAGSHKIKAQNVASSPTTVIGNANLDTMSSWTIKMRNAASAGVPQDVALADLSEETPATGDFVVGFKADGSLASFPVEELPGGGGGSTPNRHYFLYRAAALEPEAIEAVQIGTFSYAISSGDVKVLLSSYNTRLGSSGRLEIRNPRA